MDKNRRYKYEQMELNYFDGKHWRCIPVSLDDVHVKIFCPYCKEIHLHGSDNGKNYQGHRISHCSINPKRKNDNGYYIDTLKKDGITI